MVKFIRKLTLQTIIKRGWGSSVPRASLVHFVDVVDAFLLVGPVRALDPAF
jgi:hypothetical protein